MPAEGRDLRWKRWRKGAGSREWPMAYHPGDEQECRMSSHAQAKGTTRAVAVARASTGLTTHRPAGARVRAWCQGRETRLLVVTGKPVCEPHDSTGEPGAGNRPAGFGERGEETYPRATRPAARLRKRRISHRPLPATRVGSSPPPANNPGSAPRLCAGDRPAKPVRPPRVVTRAKRPTHRRLPAPLPAPRIRPSSAIFTSHQCDLVVRLLSGGSPSLRGRLSVLGVLCA